MNCSLEPKGNGWVTQLFLGIATTIVILIHYPFFVVYEKDQKFLTFYTIIMLSIFFFFAGWKLVLGINTSLYNKFYLIFIGFLGFWVIYGRYFLYKGEYVNVIIGKEQLTLIGLGITTVLILYEGCQSNKGVTTVVNVIRGSVIFLTLIALVEMSTNYHLPVSNLVDPKYLEEAYTSISNGAFGKTVEYDSTAVFYNVNDFSALLAVFVPFFFPQKQWTKKIRALALLEIGLIIIIMSKNDAWIAILSGGIGYGSYLILSKKPIKTWFKSLGFFIAVKCIGVNVFYVIVSLVYIIIPNKPIPSDIKFLLKDGAFGFYSAVSEQMGKAGSGTGSLYNRINAYTEAIKATLLESHGVGFGPGSYRNYMIANGEETTLRYPHCLWMEILFQYGAIVLVLLLVLLVIILYKLILKYKATQTNLYLVIIAMDISFVFASFAPSGYLQFGHLWVIIGLSFALSNINYNQLRLNKEIFNK